MKKEVIGPEMCTCELTFQIKLYLAMACLATVHVGVDMLLTC